MHLNYLKVHQGKSIFHVNMANGRLIIITSFQFFHLSQGELLIIWHERLLIFTDPKVSLLRYLPTKLFFNFYSVSKHAIEINVIMHYKFFISVPFKLHL